MPRTGTTLCHPKIGYVDLSVIPLSTRMDTPTLPQIPATKLTVTSKVQFLQLQHVFRQKCKKHNPSHARRHTLPSQLLITQFRLNTHNPSRVLQHQKQTQYSMLQIKTYSQKPISTLAILLLHHHPSKSMATKYIIIFTNPSTRAGFDTRSIFKRSLNSEFSFS